MFTFNNPSNRYRGRQPGSRQKGSRQQGNGQAGQRIQSQTCFTCGRPGHFKKDCRVTNKDSTNVAIDFALATVDLQEHELVSCQTPATQMTDNDTANMAGSQLSNLASCWLLMAERRAMLPALTQVTPCRTEQEQRLRSLWEAVGESDANILETLPMVKTLNPTTFSRLTLKDVRVVPGFG